MLFNAELKNRIERSASPLAVPQLLRREKGAKIPQKNGRSGLGPSPAANRCGCDAIRQTNVGIAQSGQQLRCH